MIANYHTHCDMCRHAGGSIEDYIKEAIEKDIDILGMSDHLPYPDIDYGYRMMYDEIDEYLDECIRVKEKYKDKLKMYIGFEGEYLHQYDKYYESLLNSGKCEYLILGEHFYKKDGELVYTTGLTDPKEYITYANKVVEAMKTGYFKYVAHPDLYAIGDFAIGDYHKKAFDILIDGAIKYDFPLEYNVNGLRRGKVVLGGDLRYQYPIDELWEMVKNSGVKVIVGSDSHSPDALMDDKMKASLKYINETGFNRISEIM